MMKILAIASILIASPALAQDEITVQAWGTTWDMGLRQVADKFTEATGVKVVSIPQSSSTEGLVKLQAMKAKPTIDVWFTTASVAARAETDTELFSPIDKSALTNAPDMIAGSYTDFWVAGYYYPVSIIYRTDMVKEPIKGWSDLWDKRFAGTLAVPSIEMYQARFLMISSLINGGGIDNVEPGFKAMGSIKPNVATWYQSDSDGRRALATGEVSVLIAPPALAKGLAEDGVKVNIVSPKPTPVMFDVMMLVNTPKKDLGQKFINFVVSAESQTVLAGGQAAAPVNNKSPMSAEDVAAMPKAENQVTFDEQKINAGVPAWTERFNKEIVN
ncbi:MAG TPA: extracellular solute-binding protein [Rhizobium sp.]